MKRSELEKKTVAELRKMAGAKRIVGASRLKKAELVERLAGSGGEVRKSVNKSSGKDTGKKKPKVPEKPAAAKQAATSRRRATRSSRKRPGAKPRSEGRGAPEAASVSSMSPKLKRAFASRPKNGEQRARASKYYLGVPETADLDKGFEYPETYGENMVSLMVRDPYWLFSYWEFAPELRGELAARIGEEALLRSRTVLRVYDVTSTDADHANGHYDIDVAPEARNWYINVARVEREYCVDIGLIAPDGSFIVIARSNRVTLPPVGPSDSVDEEWVTIEALDELYVRIDGRSGPTSGSGGWGPGGWGSGGLGR